MSDRAHLLVRDFDFVFGEIPIFHGVIIENMFVLLGGTRLNQCFMTCGKHTAGEVRGGVGLEPATSNLIQ
jgi:hypothetical protein